MRKNYLISLLLLPLLFSCGGKDTHVPEDFGYDYFPLDSGSYRIYNVVSREKNSADWEESVYQLKELVADTFSADDEVSYRLERFVRADENSPWPEAPDTVWTARVKPDRAIQTENNQRLVKLVFPVRNSRTWDGNAENTADEDSYELTANGEGFVINNVLYPETVTVMQESDTNNLVKRDLRYEVFARGIGLIYKRSEVLNFDFSTGDTINGSILIQELVSQGP